LKVKRLQVKITFSLNGFILGFRGKDRY